MGHCGGVNKFKFKAYQSSSAWQPQRALVLCLSISFATAVTNAFSVLPVDAILASDGQQCPGITFCKAAP